MSNRVLVIVVGFLFLAMAGAASALPTSGVGATAGKFDVGANGAATYTVPIQVPPGVNGMEPKLALTYSSQGRNGLFGVGWTLGGVSAISRCPATIAVDGKRSGIDFAAERFCLNGQRLIFLATGTDGVGAYREYNTEIEGFLRVRAYGVTAVANPDYFKVWAKEGGTQWFGRTSGGTPTDTRFRPGGAEALSWPLTSTEDTYGNYITYAYVTTATEQYLSQISYGGKTGTAVRTITLSVGTRTDPITAYVAGKQISTTQRVTAIVTRLSGVTASVRTYALNYEPEPSGAARSRLNSVTETSADNVPYTTPLSFTWRSAGTTSYTANGSVSIAKDASSRAGLGQWTQLVDFNSDGRADVFKVYNTTSGYVSVELATDSGYASANQTAAQLITLPPTGSTGVLSGINYWNELADINGDGVVDIFRVSNTTSGAVSIYWGNESGSFNTTPSNIGAITPHSKGLRYTNQLLDMNGDGLMDIVRVNSQSFDIQYGQVSAGVFSFSAVVTPTVNTGTLLASYTANSAEGFRSSNLFADSNGDGLVDVLQLGGASGDSAGIKVLLARFDGSFEAKTEQSSVLSVINANTPYAKYVNFANQFADVNGDGVLDIVHIGSGSDRYPTVSKFAYKEYWCTATNIPSPYLCHTTANLNYIYTVSQVNNWYSNRVSNVLYRSAHNLVFNSNVSVLLGNGNGSFLPQIKSSNVVETSGIVLDPNIQQGVVLSSCAYKSYAPSLVGSPDEGYFSNTWNQYAVTYHSCDPNQFFFTNTKGFVNWNQFADMDGDGVVDIVSSDTAGKVYVAYGKGNGTFAARVSTGATIDVVATTEEGTGIRNWSQLADLNGDGIVDLFNVSVSSGVTSTASRHLSNRAVPSLLDTVKDGVGLNTQITYAPMTDATVYTRTTGLDVYPQRKMKSASPVVKRVTTSGTGFTYTHNYSYKNARVNMWRGWLGFEQMTAVDTSVTPNRTSVTTFHQDFPYTGLVSNARINVDDGTAFFSLSRVSNIWNKRTSGQIHYRYLDDTTELVREPSMNLVQAYKIVTDYQDNAVAGNVDALPYDQYGNPEKVIVSHYNASDTLEHVTDTRYLSNYSAGSNFRGELSDQTITTTHTPTGKAARTRGVKTTYNTKFQPLSVVAQPNAGDEGNLLGLTATYSYEPTYGVPASETQQGSDAVYDASGTATHSAVSRAASYAYTGWNTDPLVVTKTSTVGGGKAPLVETTKYSNKFGVKIEYKDPAGVITQWNPDGFGRSVEELHNVGTLAAFTMAKTYAACAVDCAAGVKYVTTVTAQSGVSALTGPVITQYDALGREQRIVTDGLATKKIYRDTQYDSAGRVSKKSRPYFAGEGIYWQQSEYDLASRVSKVTAPNNATTQYVYNGLQTTVKSITPDEPVKTVVYSKDSKGQTVGVKDANGKTTSYSYGPFGVLDRITDPKSNQINLSYDIFGNKLSQTDPDLGVWQFRYNAFGDLKWQKDARSAILRYGYDLIGRTASRIEGINTTDPTTLWTYDTARVGAGRLDNAKRSTTGTDFVTKLYDYNTAGHVSAVNTALTQAGITTNYGFATVKDALGRVTDTTYPGAALKTRYKYYPSGLLDKVVKLDATGAETTTTYWSGQAYNAEDQITTESWSNGLAGARTYYPDNGALKSIVVGYAGSNIQNWSYDYYKSGNLKSQTNNTQGNATENFYYDVLDRLKLMQSPSTTPQNFDYDDLGNTTYKSGAGYYSYATTRPHAVTAIVPASLTASLPGDANNNKSYDAGDLAVLVTNALSGTAATPLTDCTRDNLTNVLDILCVNSRIADPATSANHSYLYDANGNLQSGAGRSLTFNTFNMPQTVTLGTQTSTFGYGPGLERLTKTVANGAASETTLYIEGLYERRTNGAATTQRYYVPAGDRLVAVAVDIGAGPVDYAIHTDRLGSLDVITNSARLAANDLRFDAWGLRTDGTAAASLLTPRGYTGHELDSDSGLINMNARLYDPLLGRFVSADTVLPDPFDLQSLNRYSYVLNNPFRYVDPTGHEYIGTQNGVAAFNDGMGMGGVVATYNMGSGEYSFADGSRIDAQGTYFAPSSDGVTLYGYTVANFGAGTPQGGNGVGPDYPSPAAAGVSGSIQQTASEPPSSGGCSGPAGMCHADTSTATRQAAQSRQDLLDLVGYGVTAVLLNLDMPLIFGIVAKGATAKFDPNRVGHIFRDSPGHVNPGSAASQSRFASLFEGTASNSANLRSDAVQAGIITQEAANSGVRAFSQTMRNGEQIWVTVRNGVIQNAGVNPAGALR